MSTVKSTHGMTLEERFATLDAVIARKNEQIATLQVKLAQVHTWMTSDDGLDRLIAIMKVCDQTPERGHAPDCPGSRETPRDVASERDLLRAALVGLVGVDTPEELDAMEALFRSATIPAEDKAATIDAIHALRRTER